MSASEGFAQFADGCPHRAIIQLERRPGNALNLEIGQASDRCRLRTPNHWPANMGASRWINSGGSALVFGNCSANGCPLKPDHCACGHRGENHDARRGCRVPECECIATGAP